MKMIFFPSSLLLEMYKASPMTSVECTFKKQECDCWKLSHNSIFTDDFYFILSCNVECWCAHSLSHMLITTEYKFQSPVSKTCYGLKLNHSICKSTVEFSYFKTIHKFSKHQSVDMFFIVDFHPTACCSFNCGWKKVFFV